MKKLRQKKDKKRRSGTNRAKEWKFFTKMDGFMSQKHSVNPPSVTDTMAERHTQNTVQTKQSSDRILTAYLSLVLFSRKLVHHMC